MTSIKNVDDFIAGYPRKIQLILKRIRSTVKQAARGAEETIAYGIPTFKLEGKNLVHFSAFAYHIGFYPTPSAIAAFKKELSKYKGAQGSVQFPLDEPIPYGLIKRMTVFRVKKLSSKNGGRTKGKL